MTYTEILNYIDLNIRQKTAAKSIPPSVISTALDEVAKLAYTAHPYPFFASDDGAGSGVVSSDYFIGLGIAEIRGNGYTLLENIQFTKDPDSPDVVFIDGNSITANDLILIQFK
jgi:hypothetical protein